MMRSLYYVEHDLRIDDSQTQSLSRVACTSWSKSKGPRTEGRRRHVMYNLHPARRWSRFAPSNWGRRIVWRMAACKYQQHFRPMAFLFFSSWLIAETSPLQFQSLRSQKSEHCPLSPGDGLPIWPAHLAGGSRQVAVARVVREDY